MSRIGVWGTGVVGMAVIRYLRRTCGSYALCVYDGKQVADPVRAYLEQHDIQLYAPHEYEAFLSTITQLIPSPGIPAHKLPTHIPLIRELELFHRAWTVPTIAITGTVGKTTTTTFLSKLFTAAGHTVAVGGNIGVGLCDLLNTAQPYTYGVFEYSSAQLHHTYTIQPDIAIITNISPNHLDWHGSFAAYIAAKANIFCNQRAHQYAILPLAAASLLAPSIAKHAGKRIWLAYDAAQAQAARNLLPPQDGLAWSEDATAYITLEATATPVSIPLPIEALTYQANLLAIATACICAGINPDWQMLSDTDRPAYRLMRLPTVKSVQFFNDSKSTIPEATRAAISQCQPYGPLVLFIGGTSKGVDRTYFMREIAPQVRLCVCFGAESVQLADAVQKAGGCALVGSTLEAAFYEYITNHCAPHDVVLFSPSGASYDLFEHYEARGERFTELVMRYQLTQQAVTP